MKTKEPKLWVQNRILKPLNELVHRLLLALEDQLKFFDLEHVDTLKCAQTSIEACL